MTITRETWLGIIDYVKKNPPDSAEEGQAVEVLLQVICAAYFATLARANVGEGK